MKREILFKYFRGDASTEEEQQIQAWLESNEDNFSLFMEERNAYDILLMANDSNVLERKSRILKISPLFKNIAASICLFMLGGIVYYFIDGNKENTNMNVVRVPKGQYVELLLADSTKVWLNSNSLFKYPSDFSDENSRIVYLEGEGFFEVKKNVEKAFFVKTDLGDVAVTGTVFNLKSKINESIFETSLFEGGVSIYKDDKLVSKLEPNQKVSLEDGKYIVSNIGKLEPYLWKDGLIAFKNEKISDILDEFAKAFSVEIKANLHPYANYTYTGKFRQTDGLDYSLRILQKSIPFEYEYNTETNTIYIK